jgi:predicted nucleic acid-binding protein
LRLGLNAINGLLGSIHDHAVWVEPEAHVLVCKDPDDDIFLECAQAADADYLVTGNAKHFPQAWMRTRVVSPRAVLNLL